MTFILGIIPARGGSKGVVHKNIRILNGKPLIAYTIEAAKDSNLLSDFVVSTDSVEIAACAEKYGVTIASLRPDALATDTAKSIDVAIYEVDSYERRNRVNVDVVVLLQPTAPMRSARDIDESLRLFASHKAKSLISVFEAASEHPNVMYYMDGGVLSPILPAGLIPTRRQNFRPAYVRNGALYIVSIDVVRSQKTFLTKDPLAYVMPRERSVNIDEPFDLELAAWMMARNDA